MARRPTPIVVALKLDAKDFERGMKNASNKTGGFGKKLSGLASSGPLAIAAIGTAAIGLGVTAVTKFAEIENKVREVGTLLGDVSQEQLLAIRKAAQDIAIATGQESVEIVQGIYDSISAGVDYDKAFQFVEEAAKLAVAGNTDVAGAIDLLTSATNAFKLESSEVGDVADVFFSTVKTGKTTIAELGAAFSNVGPVAASVGVDLKDVAGWMAQLTLSGTPTATAATQVRAALAELSKPGTKAANLFEELADTSFPKFIDGGGSVEDAMKLLDGHMKTTGQSALEFFGRIDGAQAVMGATGASAEAFAATLASVADSSGAADQAFEVMSEGTQFKLDQLKQVASMILVELGAVIADFALQAVQDMTKWLEENEAMLNQMGEDTERIMGGTAEGIGASFNTILGLFDAFKGVLTFNWLSFWKGLETAAKGALDVVIAIFRIFGHDLREMIDETLASLRAIPDAFAEGIGKVTGAWESFRGAIGRRLPSVNFDALNLGVKPTLPRLARGGIVNQPTIALIGESGPEAVVPLNRGNGGAGGVTVNLYGPVYGGSRSQMADSIITAITEWQRVNGPLPEAMLAR